MTTESFRLDRRTLLTGAAATAAAAAALPGLPVRASQPMEGLIRPMVYRFAVGDMTVTTILDGAIQLDGPHPIFGENVTAEDVAALAEENFLPATRMEIAFTVTVVDTGSEVILFDSGNGAGRRPNAGLLLSRLEAAELGAADIDRVVITHFHGDHIGGLMEEGKPAFPNAVYTFGAREYDFWTDESHASNDAMKDRVALVQSNVVPLAEKATMIEPGGTVAPGIEAIDTFGHTPGHMAYHLESNGERFVIIGDAANHYVMSMQRPDWHVRFDMDKEAAVASRKKILGMIAADRIPFTGYHMPPPAVGFLEAQGEGFRYIPASYQLNL